MSRLGPLEVSAVYGVRFRGVVFHMTYSEQLLLGELMNRTGLVVSKYDLGKVLWGDVYEGTQHLVAVHVGRLRKRLRGLDGAPSIRTVHRKGYVIDGIKE